MFSLRLIQVGGNKLVAAHTLRFGHRVRKTMKITYKLKIENKISWLNEFQKYQVRQENLNNSTNIMFSGSPQIYESSVVETRDQQQNNSTGPKLTGIKILCGRIGAIFE